MSITRRTSATAVANQAADARVVARALGEGVAVPRLLGGTSGRGGSGGAPAPGLFDGELASGLTAPVILGYFAASPSSAVRYLTSWLPTLGLWRVYASKS
jgi:hypothetical protein